MDLFPALSFCPPCLRARRLADLSLPLSPGSGDKYFNPYSRCADFCRLRGLDIFRPCSFLTLGKRPHRTLTCPPFMASLVQGSARSCQATPDASLPLFKEMAWTFRLPINTRPLIPILPAPASPWPRRVASPFAWYSLTVGPGYHDSAPSTSPETLETYPDFISPRLRIPEGFSAPRLGTVFS